MEVIISAEGVAFVRAPDGRLVEAGQVVETPAGSRPSAEELRRQAGTRLALAESADKSDPLSEVPVDWGKSPEGRARSIEDIGEEGLTPATWVAEKEPSGASSITRLPGGAGDVERVARGQETFLQGAAATARPGLQEPKATMEPKEPSLSDKISDIADRATRAFSDWTSSPKSTQDWPPMPNPAKKKTKSEEG